MGSKGTPAQATEVKQQQLPAWVEAGGRENYELAKQVADRPFEQYQGNRVAAESPLTQQGYGMAQAGSGANSLYDESAGLYRQAAGPLDINRFLNPYTAEVERNAIGNAERSLTSQLNNNADAARKAKAFGGSRFGIQNAVTQAEGARGIGDLSAQLRHQGFTTATDTALKDRSGIQASAAGLGNVAQGKDASWLSQLQALLMGGQQQQQHGQNVINADMQKFQERQQSPVESLNIRLAALGMTPYGKTEISNKTSTAEKPPTDWASIALGGANIASRFLPMMMSDRRMKTDIKKVGDDPLAGIPIYSYRYKDDPKSYPKVVGPMAQDIEKKYPSAVKKVGKYKTVDLNNLMEVLK